MRLRAALALSLALGIGPVAAQPSDAANPYAIIDSLAPFMETGDMDGAWRHLDRAIRDAKRLGPLTPDWALIFAMLADSIRTLGENPAYALRIVEEGLDLARQGGPDYSDEAAALEVSRAYILADLGRFDEAVTAATLALPSMRARFGDQAADDLESYARDWSKGDLTAFNTSALTLARRALDQADEAFDRGDHIAGLTAAARADLPPDAGFAPKDSTLLRAEVRALTGRALFLMGRIPQARAALQEGVATILEPGWQGADPVWRVPVPQEVVTRARLTELFFWLSRTAIESDRLDEAGAALRIAETLNDREVWRGTLLLPQVQIAQARGDEAGADALLARAEADAQALGDDAFAALMAFYRVANRAAMAPTWDAVDVSGLLQVTEATLAAALPGTTSIDPDFVRTEAAGFLTSAGAHDEALRLLRGIDRDRPARTDHQRRERRRQAETHMAAAHALASRDPSAFCPQVAGMGCVVYSDRQE
ncbi:MAG: hypothetical protein ACK4GW_07885 [Pseudorhodobacter sp.]